MKLSEARRTMLGMIPDPWMRHRRDWPHVPIRRRPMGERWEKVLWTRRGPLILMHDDLLEVQERAALAHACEHLDRGMPCDELRWQIERQVEAAVARWLIPDADRLGAALAAYDGDLPRTAAEFCVPPFIVEDRLDGLTPDEQLMIDKHRDAVA